MKRDLLIAYLRIAGYHEDHATFTRLYHLRYECPETTKVCSR